MTALQKTGPSMPSSDKSTVRVTVVFGGRSGERTVSYATAAGVLLAINHDRYEVLPVGVTSEGQWLLVGDDPAVLELGDNRPPVTITAEGLGHGRLTAPLGGGKFTVLGPTGPEILGRVDVVLPLLHGPYGEGETIQGTLKVVSISYVGYGVLASAAGMDKQAAKVLLGAAGIATALHVTAGPRAWERDPETVPEAYRSLTYPLFIKLAHAGSSLGISKVDHPEDLIGTIEATHAVDPKALVESGIVRREIEIAVLQGRDDDAPRVAEPGEIAMDTSQGTDESYDYRTKYLAHDAVAMVYPARIGPEAHSLFMDTAARVFEALGCEGLAQADFFLTDAGEAVVNEISTISGFTPFSMYPYIWQVSGLDYTELVSKPIELAMARSTDVNR